MYGIPLSLTHPGAEEKAIEEVKLIHPRGAHLNDAFIESARSRVPREFSLP